MICECSDPRCPAHAGASCEQVATATLYRVDMTDETGTAMCSGCADDAMGSGLFTTDPDDEDESGPDDGSEDKPETVSPHDVSQWKECDTCGQDYPVAFPLARCIAHQGGKLNIVTRAGN